MIKYNRTLKKTFRPQFQRGVTLIEVMISLLISSILIAGAISLFIGSKGTYRTQQSLSRLQESGRFALEFIADDIRSAGYLGCPTIRGAQGIKLIDPQNLASEFSQGQQIRGARKTNNGNWEPALPLSSLAQGIKSKIHTDNDVIDIKRGGTCIDFLIGNAPAKNELAIHNGNQCGFKSEEVLIISDCKSAEVVKVKTVSNGKIVFTNSAVQEYGAGAQVMRYIHRTYYVADNVVGVPSLYRIEQGKGAEEIVEGVEHMKIHYGSSMDSFTVDSYVSANQMKSWDNIASVRVAILLRTIDDHIATKKTGYTFGGVKKEASEVSDRRLRREFSTTISMRN